MKVVAFYSFKGGVGRTMSLLSTAYMLARRGRKVVVADWDLQAPGLSLMDCMRPKDAGPPRVGILEYLTALHPENWEQSQPPIEQMVLAPSLIEEARQREPLDGKPAMAGDLCFIPAGDLGEGVEQFIESVKRAELHNLTAFLVDLDKDPRMVFRVFREQVENAAIPWHGDDLQGPPDYLLVDCRTGITEIGDLLLGDATDFTAIVYGQDIQNLHGLEIVLNASQRQPGDLAANTMLIWSGAVAGQEELKVRQKRRKDELIRQVCRLDSLGLREPFPREFNVPFNPDLVFSEEPLVHRVPQGEFADLFDEITDYLEERCLWRDRIIEQAVAPINPQEPVSDEQRRLKIATTPEVKKELLLQDAYDRLERSRGLTQFLFNPPAWNLAGIPTPEIVDRWPEEFSSEDDRSLLLQLLAYATSLQGQEKSNIVQQMGSLSLFQTSRLIEILSEERHKWVTISPTHYWNVIGMIVLAGCEWLAMLAEPRQPKTDDTASTAAVKDAKLRVPNEKREAIDSALRKIIEGEPLGPSPELSHPLLPLLVAESIRETANSSSSFLTQWLTTRHLNALALRQRLTERACAAGDRQQLPPRILGLCWERHGVALDERGRAAEETEKAAWFDRAIDSYERSLKLRPDNADTLHNLGNALDDRGRAAEETEKAAWFDRAIDSYERSLKLRPDDADTLHNLGNALDDRGRAAEETEKAAWFDRAIDSYERSLKLRPDDADTLHNLGMALAGCGRVAEETEKAAWFDRAIDSYERSLKLRPDNADTLHNLGNALADRGRAAEETEKAAWFDRAIDSYERLLKLRPDDAGTLHNLGMALAGCGRVAEETEKAAWFDRAIDSYERSLKLRPDDAGTLHNLGNALDDRGRAAEETEKAAWFDRAIDSYERSLKLRPDDAGTLSNLTSAQITKWRIVSAPEEKASLLARAEQAIAKAIVVNPRVARYNYACVLALKGEVGPALEQLRQLLDEDPAKRQQIAKDEDFESLADHPEFHKLVAS